MTRRAAEAPGSSESAVARSVAPDSIETEGHGSLPSALTILGYGWAFLIAASLLRAIWPPSPVPGTLRDSMGATKLFY